MSEGASRIFQVLEALCERQIILIEWETPLLTRLGYPLAPQRDYLFLVPDEQLEEAKSIATQAGLLATGDDEALWYLSVLASRAYQFVVGPKQPRLILVPQSWPGVDRRDIEALPINEQHTSASNCHTLPLPVCCAAYLRIILQEKKESRARFMATADLSGILAYSLFDMSYEGDVMLCPEDNVHDEEQLKAIAEKDAREVKEAIATIEGWRLREDDKWVKDTLIRWVSGELRLENLPSNSQGLK